MNESTNRNGVYQCNSPRCAAGEGHGMCSVCKTGIDMTRPHYVILNALLCDPCAVATAIAGEEKS